MKHFIIGTAGHVDHGKTMLVKALTGKDTDRLKEEQERGISIELGFAPFVLPSGVLAGVVDVPGHERFIRNMLAGVSGMDLVLLVIAADEGIMPQTREHLEIIDLLNVPKGIIVLNKVDLVEEDWLEMIKEEVYELVEGTVLEGAPLVEVSAVTGQGIAELKKSIDSIASELKERPASGLARMPIDRVFTITGFGTVITGTLTEGFLKVGNEIEILPQGIVGRIRGLQVHGNKVDRAEAGQRVAVNISNVERETIHRGSVLANPGVLRPSHRMDIHFKLLPSAEKALGNRARVRVHIGTAEIMARIILLESDQIEPGESEYAQLECDEPMVAAKGDLLVVRSYSPMRTIGGGRIIDPNPNKHKRMNQAVIEALKTKEKGTPEELLQHHMFSGLLFNEADLVKAAGVQQDEVSTALAKMMEAGYVKKVEVDNKELYILETVFREKGKEIQEELTKYHNRYPLRPGMSKELVRGRYFENINIKLYNSLLNIYQQEGYINISSENISMPDFLPGPAENQKDLFKQIENDYLIAEYQPPGWEDTVNQYRLNASIGEEILNYFLYTGILIGLEEGIIIHSANIDKAKSLILQHLKENNQITLAEVRDILKTSRKYALPIISFLDKQKITRRIDDKRVLY